MNPHLKTAYEFGAKHAQIQFEKQAATLTPLSQVIGKGLPHTTGFNTDPAYAARLRHKRQRQLAQQLVGGPQNEAQMLTRDPYSKMSPEQRAQYLSRAQGLKLGSHEKRALDIGDVLAPAAGAIPLAGPAVAGTTGGIEVGPGFGRHVGQRTALESMKGQTIGGLGGAAIGGGLGAAAPWLGEKLDIEALEDLDPKRSALIGALLGGGLGAGIGGGIGAARGRSAGKQEVGQTEDILRAQQQAALQQRIQQALQQAYQRGGTEQAQLSQLMGY